MVDDIRSVAAEDHWKQFGRAWTELLSYRYLGKLTPELDAGAERETMPLRRDMRNSTGGIMAAPLCIASPEPYWLDTQCVPAPVMMSYDILDPARDVRQVDVLREVIHLGRSLGFSRSRVVDAADHDRLIATSCGVGASLGEAPPGYEKVSNPPVDVEDAPDLPPLVVAFRGRRGDDGRWRLPEMSASLSAPHAALHLGPINIVLEAAAMDIVADDTGTDAWQVEAWTVMMVRPGVTGPFRAEGEAVGRAGERLAVELTLHDEGKDDRVISTAWAAFRRALP